MDQPIRYRALLELVPHYGVFEDPRRGKGSERLWIRQLPDGSKRSIPVTCHHTGDVVGVGLVKAIRRRLLLTEKDGVPDEEFYARK
ncbi:MAG: hypothetical protein FJ011_21450 [Chloroflexi bacterium]|nr:hypothetical protein [Chloroflexota bacterium]